MSGHLQYSNYGEDEKPPSIQQQQPQPQPQPQHKRTLRTNQRTLRSKQPTHNPGPTSNPIQSQGPQPQPQPQPQQQRYMQELIQKIHNAGSDSESDSDTNESNEYSHMQQQFQTAPVSNMNRFTPANSADLNARLNPASAKEGFASKGLASNPTPPQNPYPQYMPSVFQASDGGANDPQNKDIMLQKLDHIISLLEDQRDASTGHVTEELVLYCFLGVFIIFIVDSFARAGKYVR